MTDLTALHELLASAGMGQPSVPVEASAVIDTSTSTSTSTSTGTSTVIDTSTSVVIDASAIVDAGATIGAGTRVWHFSHVCAGARIGPGCSLGQNVFVGNDVQIGARVKIQNNVSVYDAVTIEDDVFCGPSMVFTNVYNPRAALVRKDEYRRTLVQHGATIGANATIVCGVTIGQYAFIGAGAVVNRDVPAFALMTGVPARQDGWMSRHGERLALAAGADGTATCPRTGEVYTVRDGVCSLEPVPATAAS